MERSPGVRAPGGYATPNLALKASEGGSPNGSGGRWEALGAGATPDAIALESTRLGVEPMVRFGVGVG